MHRSCAQVIRARRSMQMEDPHLYWPEPGQTGSTGEARMPDPPWLLEGITALRQRLDIAATGDALPAEPSTAGQALVVLEQRLSASQEHGQIVETAVRQLVEEKSQGPLPSR